MGVYRLMLSRDLQREIQSSLEGTHRQFANLANKGDENKQELKEFMQEMFDSHEQGRGPREEADTRLSWLSRIDYSSQQASLTRQRGGRGRWLLVTDEFTSWLGKDSQVMFCHGDPGAGKTFLTSLVVDSLQTQFGKENGIGVAYLYCSFQQHKRTVEDFSSNILKQLAEQQNTLPECIQSLQSHKSGVSTERILESLHSIIAGLRRTFIVVDALDECRTDDGSQTKLISQLIELGTKRGVSVFTTSRSILGIMSKFEGCIRLPIRAEEKDVIDFLEANYYRIPVAVGKPEIRGKIEAAILKSINGM